MRAATTGIAAGNSTYRNESGTRAYAPAGAVDGSGEALLNQVRRAVLLDRNLITSTKRVLHGRHDHRCLEGFFAVRTEFDLSHTGKR
jgi:hypothetical protein